MLGKAALGLGRGIGVRALGATAVCVLTLSVSTLSVATLLLPGFAVPAKAAEKNLTDKGQVLVKENCGRCHAIGKEGDSPHEEAPPFRTLSSKYPVGDLAESLAEGIVSGHPEMPIFVFEPQDVAAIIDYLESIQDAPASPPAEAPAEPPAGTPPQ